MKTKILLPLFLSALVSFSLYSCTEDAVVDTRSQATEVTHSKPKIPNDVTAEDIIVNPR